MEVTMSLKPGVRFIFILVLAFTACTIPAFPQGEQALHQAELIFPPEHWHNHSSCIVEQPNRDLLVCWFHGSGERTADDVVLLGARKKAGAREWSKPFLMEDVPGHPDTNPAIFIDPRERLWLIWPTILANEWHTALLKYRISANYEKEGPPDWETSRVLHLKPGEEFLETVVTRLGSLEQSADLSQMTNPDYTVSIGPEKISAYFQRIKEEAAGKLQRRLGWMTRAHPVVLEGGRMIVPLYSDGFSFSLMAITDDWGKTWTTSTPLVGIGNIQPSIAVRKDGSLVAYMRDAGTEPRRLQVSESFDRGETWSPMADTDIPNPGSGAEVITLKNGNWLLAHNDLEEGRYSLAVALSDDEGRTWKWKRHLELDMDAGDTGHRGSYHYPTVIEGRDGTFHASYSYSLRRSEAATDTEGRLMRKSIKHARFNGAWIMQGDPH